VRQVEQLLRIGVGGFAPEDLDATVVVEQDDRTRFAAELQFELLSDTRYVVS
jgi:hypothetical protein